MATYYVATDGSGDYTTIAQVNAATFQPGDNVLFRNGDSWDATLIIPSSGILGNQIIYGSYGSGDRPNIHFINIVSKEYITIRGLQSNYGAIDDDIIGGRGGNNIIIEDVYVNGQSQDGCICIQFYSNGSDVPHDIIVRNSTFVNGGINDGTQNGYGLNITGGGHDFIVEDCIFTNNQGGGIQAYDNSAEKNNPCYNITFKNNRVTSNQFTVGEGINPGWNVKNFIAEKNYVEGYGNGIPIDEYNTASPISVIIRNNIIVNALQLCRIAPNSENTYIENNTFIAGANTVKTIWYEESTSGTNNNCKNNIILSLKHYWPNVILEPGVSANIDYNLYYNAETLLFHYGVYNTGINYTSLSDWQLATSQDLHSISADPLLNSDYTLKAGSPCINAGVKNLGVDTDYNGVKRRGTPDIGAYEYVHVQPRNCLLRNCHLG